MIFPVLRRPFLPRFTDMQMHFRIRHFERYVGILVVLSVILAILAVVFVARGQKWFAKRANYKIIFSKGHGLKPGTPVTISGMEVGNLKSLQLTPGSEVEMTVYVFQQYKFYIRKDSEATITSPLVGAKSVEIDAGSPNEPPIPEGGVIPSREPRELTDIIKDIDIKTPLAKLDMSLENLKSLTAKLNDPEGELFSVLKNAEMVTSQLKNGQGAMGALLQDPGVHRDMAASLATLRRSLANVEEVTRRAQESSRSLPDLEQRVDLALTDVRSAAAGLSSIMDDVKKATAHTPAIAENVKEITTEGRSIVRDVKEITGSAQKASPQIPDLLETTEETVGDVDTLVQGLQRHWLLRGFMPKVKTEMPIAIGQRESPYQPQGENR